MTNASRSSCERTGGSATTSHRLWIGAGPPASQARKTGRPPGLPYIGAVSAEQNLVAPSVPSRRTDSKAGAVVCARAQLGLSVIASATPGVGDSPQPHRLRTAGSGEVGMSHAAIAAVLARHDLSAGERLVAWSLASFGNREQLARPGMPVAAARAGLSRSRYHDAREQLVRRGLLEAEKEVGRGRTCHWRTSSASPGSRSDARSQVLAYSGPRHRNRMRRADVGTSR